MNTPWVESPFFKEILATKQLSDKEQKMAIDYNENGLIDKRETVIIDERERVKETFAKNVTSTQTVGNKCSLINSSNPNYSCVNEAFVKVNPIKRVVGKVNFTAIKDLENITADIFYCNFHFRRESNRYHNNGVVYEDYHKVLDERYRMKMTLNEEAKRLTYI